MKLLDTSRHLLRAARQAHPGPRRERGRRCSSATSWSTARPGELLLQIFSENQLGPIFFEFIQRKGNQGFGEGNFKALFESIELDQMRRGVLKTRQPRLTRSELRWPKGLPDDSHSGVNQGVAPVTYGASDRPPRGDYARAGADYTCAQDYGGLHRGRPRHLPPPVRAPGCSCCRAWPATSSSPPCRQLGAPRPHSALRRHHRAAAQGHRLGDRRRARADSRSSPSSRCWRNREFPVTDWMRKPEEFDYIVEPDVFHDLFGHVPLLFNPVFADYMQAYGAGGLKAQPAGRLRAARAPVLVHGRVRPDRHAAGPARLRRRHPELAGRAAPRGHSPEPQRLAFDLERADAHAATSIDTYQADLLRHRQLPGSCSTRPRRTSRRSTSA